jgi:hypothetical protein
MLFYDVVIWVVTKADFRNGVFQCQTRFIQTTEIAITSHHCRSPWLGYVGRRLKMTLPMQHDGVSLIFMLKWVYSSVLGALPGALPMSQTS